MKFSSLYKLFTVSILLFTVVFLITKVQTTINIKNNANISIANSQLIEDVFKSNIQSSDTIFGIVVWDLNTGKTTVLNEDEQFEAASLYKLAVMYTLFYLESKGELDTDRSDINNNLNLMITVSSNEAALYLVNKYTSWNEITKLMKEKGLKSTDFSESLLLTTPKDMAMLLALINDPNDISPKARDKMTDLLNSQTINDRIPALLPAGATVYHKTGEVDDTVHDVGIVKGPTNINYILVIMTKNSVIPDDTKRVMAKISKEIYSIFDKPHYLKISMLVDNCSFPTKKVPCGTFFENLLIFRSVSF